MGLNQRVSPGDRIKIEARDWNDILAAAAKAREHSTTPAPQIEPTDYACTVVCVRNDSGALRRW